jgi:hypothetical protein
VTLTDNQDSAATTLSGLPASISGLVWNDGNENGTIDPEESFVPGVLITLNGTDVFNNTIAATAFTDANGQYAFPGLVPGTYSLSQTQPAGFSSVADQLGTVYLNGTTPPGVTRGVNADPLDDALTGIVLNSNERGINYNFAEVAPAVVSGRLYYDNNNNSLPDPGEQGVVGVDLVVTDTNGLMQTVTTNSSGNWTVTVPQGTTTIDIDESDPQFPTGLPRTQGDDPTVAEAISNATVSGGLDGFFINLDSDDDGIPDTLEQASACVATGDTDGDGVPDILDLDSDGDGIFDLVEAGLGALDADRDGRIDGFQGFNGLADIVETSADSGSVNYTLPDTDADGRPDHLDLDADNDSIGDVLESGNGFLTDLENDGIADGVVDGNGLVLDAGRFDPVDTDFDFVPDYIDLDSNEDGLFDITDNGFSSLDLNGDGRIDNDASPTDCDGIADVLDPRPEEYGWFPRMGCVAWNNTNTDTDGDIFPAVHEYAFGTDPAVGDHVVVGTERQAGMVLTRNDNGDVDLSYVRPAGRFDMTVQAYVNTQPTGFWSELTDVPEVIDNDDGTQTILWRDVNRADGVFFNIVDHGFVRLVVSTPCSTDASTQVQGWSRQAIEGKYQTYGWNFNSLAYFSGLIDSVSGDTLITNTSGNGLDLSNLIPEGVACFVEITDGLYAGHRFEVAAGGVDQFQLDLSSSRNTLGTLPTDLAGSHFILRPHATIGQIFPPEDWAAATSPGAADQVLLYNGVGYDTYFNQAIGGSWVRQGAGFGSRNGEPVPPGTGMMVVRASDDDTDSILAIGTVRENAFRLPVEAGSTGFNFISNGFPYPYAFNVFGLNINEGNGFPANPNLSLATQVLIWKGDADPAATGWTTFFQAGNFDWREVGNPGSFAAFNQLFQPNRAAHVKVPVDVPEWTHPKPWGNFSFPPAWQQPAVDRPLRD